MVTLVQAGASRNLTQPSRRLMERGESGKSTDRAAVLWNLCIRRSLDQANDRARPVPGAHGLVSHRGTDWLRCSGTTVFSLTLLLCFYFLFSADSR